VIVLTGLKEIYNMKNILAVLAFCSLFVGQASAGLIYQDDFGTGDNKQFHDSLGAWNVTQGNVELWNIPGWDGYAVDLNGYPSTLGGIETSETFTFLANGSYVLSFLLGNNQNLYDNGILYGFRNDDGILASGEIGNLESFLEDLNVKSTVISLFFSPKTDVEASIFFTSTGTADIGGAIIDNVSLVPEPSTLAILGLGLMGLASRRLKK
jgi:hypothetical protein